MRAWDISDSDVEASRLREGGGRAHRVHSTFLLSFCHSMDTGLWPPRNGKHGQTAETRKCCDGEILDNIVYQRGNALRLDTDEWSRVVTDSVIH